MAKTDNRPKEKMHLVIEFADNGIILRNPGLEDEVTLALTKDRETSFGGYLPDHSDEHLIIGRKIYDWLVEEVIPDHADTWITTGALLDITATLNGRK